MGLLSTEAHKWVARAQDARSPEERSSWALLAIATLLSSIDTRLESSANAASEDREAPGPSQALTTEMMRTINGRMDNFRREMDALAAIVGAK